MTFLSDFTEGFAQLLAAASIGLTYADEYTPDQTGIGLMTWPLGLPGADLDNAVALAPYPLVEDPTLGITTLGLQIRSRAAGRDPRAVWAIDDAIAGVLLGRYPLTLPTGVRINTLVKAGSPGSTGVDDSQRWTWLSNYVCSAMHPTAHRF